MPEHEACRVLIAFAPEIVGEALEDCLSKRPHLEIVGRVRDGVDLGEAVRRWTPDVVLFDPRLPGLEPPRLEQLVEGEDPVRLLALDLFHDGSRSWELLRRGAAGYLDAEASGSELLQALEAVARGESFISSRATRGVIERMGRVPGEGRAPEVTAREREILHLVAEGLSSKEIARRLHLSARTVETHRVHLMGKLHAENTAHLVRLGIREGVIGP